ncbi:MAG TPA: histidine kinase, partial [Bacteroidia bacterium]|nr:histidine kinase [Bacteroidia bacterium]
MLIESSGLVIMSTYNNGFYIYDPRDSTVEYHQIGDDPDNENYRTCITTDHKNQDNLWVGTTDGIFLFNLKTKQAEKRYEFPYNKKAHFADYPISIVYMDEVNDSMLCIGTDYHGMGIYNIKRNTLILNTPTTWKTGTSLYRTVVDGINLGLEKHLLVLSSVAKKSSNEYYVYYRDSLPLIFNCSTQKYLQLRNPGFINEKKIKWGTAKLSTDKKGNLWIGESKYLYVFSKEFNLFTSKVSPDTTMYYPVIGTDLISIIWDNRIKNYYATVAGSPYVYLLDSNFQVTKKMSTSHHGVFTFLLQDPEGNIWALNWGGVRGGISICRNGSNHFEPAEKIYHILSSLVDMRYITSDDKNNIIFSKKNGNLFFLDITTLKLDSLIFPKIDSSLQFNFNELSPCLYYDATNNYIFVSNEKNVLQYDRAKKAYKIFTKDSSLTLNKADFSYFSFDKNGQIWTSTQNKIQMYDGVEFKLQKEILLKNSRNEKFTIIGLLPGPPNYMFILLEGGMALYNYNNDSYTLFDKENGLLHDDFRLTNYANNTYISAYNNSIEFAAFDKLLSLNYQRTSKINQVKIYNNKMISFADLSNNNIQLSYKRNTIGISFSAIEYLFPERIQYAFRLSAVDSNWKYVDYKNREIIFSNLRPRKYVFELKAQVLGGNWEQDPLKLYITITPPFWQTWWFRTIAAISIIGLLYWLFKIRIASVRKKEQLNAKHEKELLELEAKALRAQMNPHFVFNCMNSIKALIQNDEKQRSIEYLTTFSKLIRTLFQNSDKRQISLFDEIETCRLYT